MSSRPGNASSRTPQPGGVPQSGGSGDIPTTLTDSLLNSGRGATFAGSLQLDVIAARMLCSRDYNGKSDPFVEVWLNGIRKHKTDKKLKTLDPIWNESVTLDIPTGGADVDVTVWDWDKVGRSEFLGRASLRFGQENCRIDQWYVLEPREGSKDDLKFLQQQHREDFGEIHLAFTYEYSLMSSMLGEAINVAHERRLRRVDGPTGMNGMETGVSPIVLKENLSRLVDWIDVVIEPVLFCLELFMWQRPQQSLLALLIFTWVCYWDLLLAALPGTILAFLVRCYWLRVRQGPSANFHLADIMDHHTKYTGAFSVVNRTRKVTQKLEKVQIITGVLSDKLEEFGDIITWQKRTQARKLVQGLSVATLLLALFPLPPMRYFALLVGWGCFTVLPLSVYFPSVFNKQVAMAVKNKALVVIGGLEHSSLARNVLTIIKRPPSGTAWRKQSAIKKIDRAKAYVYYTCCLTFEFSRPDDNSVQIAAQVKRLTERLPVSSIEPRHVARCLLAIIERIKSTRRYFLVPPKVVEDWRMVNDNPSFTDLDPNSAVVLRDFGVRQSLVQPELHPEYTTLVGRCMHGVTTKVNSEHVVLNIGLLLNAFLQSNLLAFCDGNRVSVLYRVFGSGRNPVETFEPAMNEDPKCPNQLLSLVSSCCNADPLKRPSLRQVAATLSAIRREGRPRSNSRPSLIRESPVEAPSSASSPPPRHPRSSSTHENGMVTPPPLPLGSDRTISDLHLTRRRAQSSSQSPLGKSVKGKGASSRTMDELLPVHGADGVMNARGTPTPPLTRGSSSSSAEVAQAISVGSSDTSDASGGRKLSFAPNTQQPTGRARSHSRRELPQIPLAHTQVSIPQPVVRSPRGPAAAHTTGTGSFNQSFGHSSGGSAMPDGRETPENEGKKKRGGIFSSWGRKKTK